MATLPAENSALPEAVSAKVPLLSLLITVIVSVLFSMAALGGAVWYLVHSGRLPLQRGVVVDARPIPSAVVASHVMSLEPMVANLADAGGATYLKLSLALRIADEPTGKNAAAKEEKTGKEMSDEQVAVRDTVLMVLGRQNTEALLEIDGKERLKAQLKAALSQYNPTLKVMDIYFTDFLVQR